MIIIGVDPGTITTGYGVISHRHGKMFVLEQGCIRTSSKDNFPSKLKTIYDGLCRIINIYHPDEFAIEDVFYGENVQTALKIGHARGVAILAAINNELKVAEYSPREVKLAVAGNGNASKEQVQFMVTNLLKLKEKPTPHDVSDALAVAICHINRGSATKKQVNTWEQFIKENPDRVKND